MLLLSHVNDHEISVSGAVSISTTITLFQINKYPKSQSWQFAKLGFKSIYVTTKPEV